MNSCTVSIVGTKLNPLYGGAIVMKTEIKIIAAPAPENFAQALGIGNTREGQLCDLIGQCYDSTDTYPQAIADIAQQVDDMNELAYALFHLGAFAGNEQAKQAMIRKLEEE